MLKPYIRGFYSLNFGVKKSFLEKSFLLFKVTHKSELAEGISRFPKRTTHWLANIPFSKSENVATFLFNGLPLTWSLSPGETVVPPGNARSPAASPSGLPVTAAGPPFGAPAPFPALEAGIERWAEPPSGILFPGSALVSKTQEYLYCRVKGQQEDKPKHIPPDKQN